MIEEAYCSFETCKLLKEKGFPQDPYICNTAYTFRGKLSNNARSFMHPSYLLIRTCTIAPTQQMAMRWLREEKGLFVSIGCDDLDWNWQIFDIKNRDENLDPICMSESHGSIKTYEEAVEDAIKYCLENLIK